LWSMGTRMERKSEPAGAVTGTFVFVHSMYVCIYVKYSGCLAYTWRPTEGVMRMGVERWERREGM
jgi:hypothetical protein